MSVVDLFQAEDVSKDLEVRRIVKALKRVEISDLKRVYTILGILVDE